MMIIKPYNKEMGNNNTRNDLRKRELKFILSAGDAKTKDTFINYSHYGVRNNSVCLIILQKETATELYMSCKKQTGL